MTIKAFKYILPLTVTALAFLSCVKESDPEDCPVDETGSVILYVDFVRNLYSTLGSAVQEEVETMYVFVFSHDGYYLRTLFDPTPEIGSEYQIPVPLPPGDYEFIGWSNLRENFKLPDLDLKEGETTVEEMFVELDLSSGDTIRGLKSHLHYGLVREPRSQADNKRIYNMYLDRYTYTVNILTEGLEPDNDDYLYVISDHNGRFSFYSDDISDRTIYYVADCDKDAGGQLSASLRVLRLLEDHMDSTIRIENKRTGEVLYDDFLIERLLSLRDLGEHVDFNTCHEYTIKLIFSANLLVAIQVNGWVVYKHDDYEV